MARDDLRWFVVGVVILSCVILLGLPIMGLMLVDYMKMKTAVQIEIKVSKQMRREMYETLQDNRRQTGNNQAPTDSSGSSSPTGGGD